MLKFMVQWIWASFKELSLNNLYEVLALRQKIFIVEQQCAYLDADGLDQDAQHLLAYQQVAGVQMLVGYLRVLPPGKKHTEHSAINEQQRPTACCSIEADETKAQQ